MSGFVEVMVCALTPDDIRGYVTADKSGVHVRLTPTVLVTTNSVATLRYLGDLFYGLASDFEYATKPLPPISDDVLALEKEAETRMMAHKIHVDQLIARLKATL